MAYHGKVAPEIFVAVQIETAEGLANVEEIAAIAGIDALFIGPVDLRIALRCMPSLDGQESTWVNAIEKISAAAKRHGKQLCTVTDGKPESVAKWADLGFHLLTVGSDTSLLTSAATALLKSHTQ